MPQAIPLILSQGTTLFGWTALTTSLVTIGSTLAVGAYEQKRAKQKARDAYNKSLQDHLIPVKSGVAARCYVLGTVRTSGPVMYVETIGPKKSAFDLIIAIANNECTLNGWYFNEEFVSVADFPGDKYGQQIAVPTSDEFTVNGTSTSVTLSGEPVTTVNAIRATWRKDGATGFATVGALTGGVNLALSGLPAGQSVVTVSYSAYQAENIAAQFQEGAESQAASNWDSLGLSSPGWTTNHRLRGIANARCLFQWEDNLYQSGAPAVGVVVTGRGIASHPFYDPRNGSNPSTTKNPALLAAWWMTLPRAKGGCGIPSDWIDWQSISVAASICDELVPLKNHSGSGYTMAPRYECNCLLSTDDAPLVNLETILSAMAGRRAFTGGLYKIVAGAFRPATVTITDRDVVGDEPITVSTGSNEDSPPNIVTATFCDARADYLETQPTAVRNDTYITLDGSENPLDISLPATTDARRARYLMGITLEGSRPAMACQIRVGGIGENLTVFDTVQLSLTNRSVYSGRTLEIVSIVDRWDGTFDLELVEIKPQTWALDPDDYLPVDPAELPDISYLWNPPHPAGFTVNALTPQLLPDGTSLTRVELSWNALPAEGNSPNARIELRYRVAGGDWIGIAPVPGDATSSVVTAALIDGEIYEFQARFVNGIGSASAWVNAFTHIDGTPLPVPLSMRLRTTGTIFRVPQSGNAVPLTITLEAVKTDGLAAAAVFTTSPSVSLTGSGDTRTLSYAAMGANDSVQITCTVTQGGVDYIDTVTILKVYDGVDADTSPDLTPPPTPTGLAVTAFMKHLLVTWSAPVYTQGHGHDITVIYAAQVPTGGPQPTFSSAVAVDSAGGNAYVFPADPGTRWAIWIRWQSRDGILSTSPAGGTNGVQATAAQIGNVNLGPLIVEAGNLADGAVTSAKIAPASLDITKFANNIQPISIVTSVPSTLGARTVFNTTDGQLYRWNGSAYVRTVAAGDVTGQLTDAQIAALAAAKLTGQITSTQITDGAISTPKLAAGSVTTNALQANAVLANNIAAGAVTTAKLDAAAVTSDKLAANSVTAGKIAAAAVSATEIAAGAITASKIAITGRGAALNDDPACIDQTAWALYPSSGAGTFACNTPMSGAPGGTVMRVTDGRDVLSRQFPVAQGKRYRISAWARKVSGGGSCWIGCLFYPAGASGNAYTAAYYIPEANGSGLPGTLTRFTGFIDTPANVVNAAIYIAANWNTTGVSDFADVRVEEVVPGELIVDGAITARKLFITGGGGALNDDPSTRDATAWNAFSGTFSISTITDTQGVLSVIRSTSNATWVISRPVQFNPNKAYRVRARARNVGGNGTFYLAVDLRDSSNSVINGDGTFWMYNPSGISLPSSFTQYEAKFGAGTSRPFPSNARTMSVGVILNYQGSAGYHEATDVLIEECVDSGIVVDGAIQAQHLAANSIAVGTAAIQNGAIVNAMIANAAIDSAKILNLQVEKLTSGTLGAEINVGSGRITFDNGAVMRVMGLGFGSSNQFIEWFGPKLASLSQCTEANAITYLKTNGSAYWGGSLSAGTLYNSKTSTSLAGDAQLIVGPFGTNGNPKQIVLSYSYIASKTTGGGGGNSSGSITATLRLWQKIGSGTETLVATLNVTGTYTIVSEPGISTYQQSMGDSLTYTDNIVGTADRTYRAEIIARSLNFVPPPGVAAQTITITSTEQ